MDGYSIKNCNYVTVPSRWDITINRNSKKDLFKMNSSNEDFMRSNSKRFDAIESTISRASNEQISFDNKFDDSSVNEIADFLEFSNTNNLDENFTMANNDKIKFGRLNSNLSSQLTDHPCAIQIQNEMNHYLREKCDSYYTKHPKNSSPNMIKVIDEYVLPPSSCLSTTDYSLCLTEEDPHEGSLSAKITPLSTAKIQNKIELAESNLRECDHPHMINMNCKIEQNYGDESLMPESLKSSVMNDQSEIIEYQEIIDSSDSEFNNPTPKCEIHYFSSSSEIDSHCDVKRGIVSATNAQVSINVIQEHK